MPNFLNNCSTCGTKLRVTETVNGTESIFRMRRCDPCKWLIVTEEKVADEQMIPYRHRQAKRKTQNHDT